jgi:alpha-1,6-mannosyltransferase
MLTRHSPRARPQALAALAGLVVLEALFFGLGRLGNLEQHVVEVIALALVAGIVYFLALFLLEHTGESSAAFWLILVGAIAFRLTLLPLVPTLSNDIYRYRFDGYVQHAGLNPYLVRPDEARFARPSGPPGESLPGHDIPTIYPPLAELVYRLAWPTLRSPAAFKLPFVAADILVLVLLAFWVRRTRASNVRLAIYAWNPLVVVEFAASGHNDSLALAAVVAATFLIIGRREVVSTFALAAAALAKVFPLVLFPLWLARTWRSRSWRQAAWSLLGAIGLAALCAWPYRAALGQLPATLADYQQRWRANNASLYALVVWATHVHRLAVGLGAGVVAGLALWVAGRQWEPARAAFLLFGAILLLSGNAMPWYFTWVVPFLAILPWGAATTAWLLLTVLQFLSYHVLIDYSALGIWHFRPLMLWLEYAPFFAWLVWVALRRQPWRA